MRIAIYGRVSTEGQEKEQTIFSQIAALKEYAQNNNHVICGEYLDEGYSGEMLDRPALDRLRDDAKQKLFEAILVHSPDRLSRKFIYLGLLQEEFKKSGIAIIFLNRPDSKDTPEENLLSGVQGLIAEYEKAKILERTRRGKHHNVKSGRLVTSMGPYGYKYIINDKSRSIPGHYEVIPEEAEIVKLVFKLLIDEEVSLRGIAIELTKRGIPPRKGENWQLSTLSRLLRNETYIGVTYYNKSVSVEPTNNVNKYRRHKNSGRNIRPKEQWMPINLPDNLRIIDKKTFAAAQKQLKRNAELSPRNVKYSYLLRGLIKCGNCDAPFVGDPSHGFLYYRCANRGRTFPLPQTCRVKTVRAEHIENVVWETFCKAIRNPLLITQQVAKLREKKIKNKASSLNDIESIEKAITITTDEENRLLDAYRGGIVSMEQLKGQMVKIQAKRERLNQEKQGLQVSTEADVSPVKMEKTIVDYCKQISERLASLENDPQGKSYLLHLALNRINLKGKEVRIKGIIPTIPAETLLNSGSIASTLSLWRVIQGLYLFQ